MAQWSEESRKTGNVTFTSCNIGGQPINLLFEDVKIPFEPSQFGGDGTEIRRSLCFRSFRRGEEATCRHGGGYRGFSIMHEGRTDPMQDQHGESALLR